MKTAGLLLLLVGCVACGTSEKKDAVLLPPTVMSNETVKVDSLQNSLQSELTCPECGHKQKELMPTEVCLLKYTCTGCSKEFSPKKGDCCVFCSYGTHKCPSMQ
jgi:hypothetical protein